MPELHFKGKEYVFNHHLSVPFRPLLADPEKSIGEASDNLIVHGDNLHALKALLPQYAGSVDVVFIDPPYNTGEENWHYNDNVNSPWIKDWLAGNPVDSEDMIRHDKWLCLMYPRLRLLHELMADHGTFWMTLDDNEVHHARVVLDEIFGEENFVACVVWQKRTSPDSRKNLGAAQDYLLVYAKDRGLAYLNKLPLTDSRKGEYSNPDDDPRGDWASVDLTAQAGHGTADQFYTITAPSGGEHNPSEGRCWGLNESTFESLVEDDRIWWGAEGTAMPRLKKFLLKAEDTTAWTWWTNDEVGHNQEAKKGLLQIMGEATLETPKPMRLLSRIMQIATNRDSLVLDSFAGSGTTAHAVLQKNLEDDGRRRFILVECEDYADRVTAERVRRVITGYKTPSTHKKELLREKITWTAFSSDRERETILEAVEEIVKQESPRFDRVVRTIDDGHLVVTGEVEKEQDVAGLGGDFCYATLGDPLDMDRILTGEELPNYETLGAWLFHTATGESLNETAIDRDSWYLGESEFFHVWLIYKPNLEFLRSNEAALTISVARTVSEVETGDKKKLIFAPARYVPNSMLVSMGIQHAPVPFALYRIETE